MPHPAAFCWNHVLRRALGTGLLVLLIAPSLIAQEVRILSNLYQDFEVTGGASYEGVILVENTSEQPHELKIYQSDMAYNAEGAYQFGDPGSFPRSNASWIALPPTVIKVPPRTRVNVPYSLSVPADPALQGTYWSVIMVEPVPENGDMSSVTSEMQQGGATLRFVHRVRYAVKVNTHIAGTGRPDLKLIGAAVQEKAEGKVLVFDVENRGDRGVKVPVTVEVYDEAGALVTTLKGLPQMLHPGMSARFELDASSLPEKKYTGLLLIDLGKDDLFGVQINVEL